MTDETFLNQFENKKTVSVKWYWEPFHKNGLAVISWMEERLSHLSFEEKEKLVNNQLENISVMRAPPQIKKRFPDLIDKYGRLLPLDPSKRIAETLNNYKNSDFYVSKISEIKSQLNNHKPDLENTDEYVEIRKLWSSSPDILARFDNLAPWDQLEVLESLFGLTKSHTTLHFKLIDG